MSKLFVKRDRTARLLNLQILLWQHPNGLTVVDIAKRCNVSLKTVYRDLGALENELGVPVWEEGTKRGITEGHFLPPISFSVGDAVNVFLATSYMQSYFSGINRSVANTFMKLDAAIPSPLRQQIQDIIDSNNHIPVNERISNNFDKLIQAWLTRHQVTIQYQELSGGAPAEYLIDPYFFAPAWWGRAYFVIAYSHQHQTIRSFYVAGIVGEASISSHTYEIPASFNAADYLKYSWGAVAEGEINTVKLRFKPGISRVLMFTAFHPSQQIEQLADGAMLLTLTIRNTPDFLQFVLSLGCDAEVLEPAELRDQVIKINQSIMDLYRHHNSPAACEITDPEWQRILPILPPPSLKGRPRSDERNIINGILWVLRNGKRWSDMPREYGSRSTCHSRLLIWQKTGVWDKILYFLLFNPERPQ
jgi:predicted DNA-binding transcriptional regulator YafY